MKYHNIIFQLYSNIRFHTTYAELAIRKILEKKSSKNHFIASDTKLFEDKKIHFELLNPFEQRQQQQDFLIKNNIHRNAHLHLLSNISQMALEYLGNCIMSKKWVFSFLFCK